MQVSNRRFPDTTNDNWYSQSLQWLISERLLYIKPTENCNYIWNSIYQNWMAIFTLRRQFLMKPFLISTLQCHTSKSLRFMNDTNFETSCIHLKELKLSLSSHAKFSFLPPFVILASLKFVIDCTGPLHSNANSLLRYQGTPNDNIAFSPFERQAFHKDPSKLYIFWKLNNWRLRRRI